MADTADGSITTENVGGPTEAPQESTPDPIMARLDELQSQIGSLVKTPQADERGLTDSLTQQPESEAEYAPEGAYEGYEDGYQEEGYDPQAEQQAVQQLQHYIDQQIQQGVQGHITPWMHQQKAMQLEQKYPELAQDATQTVKAAEQYAQRINRPEMARDPDFIELVYLAQRASQQAQQETPAGADSEVHLEGGGAAPGQPEESVADRIVNAGTRSDTAFKWH